MEMLEQIAEFNKQASKSFLDFNQMLSRNFQRTADESYKLTMNMMSNIPKDFRDVVGIQKEVSETISSVAKANFTDFNKWLEETTSAINNKTSFSTKENKSK